ncbi:hypothetical protein DERP_012952 [Dermatophagoides pteronyssinus]|uniref:Uncharacterized protein n=1 Tax=Dermatophagoides pteronyssinus TaxID=6956 RepID=A0ABQ8J424_DERPT|nr:hypothetical protein DERP_012952 [Dermatophagoides pteronyssinus]
MICSHPNLWILCLLFAIFLLCKFLLLRYPKPKQFWPKSPGKPLPCLSDISRFASVDNLFFLLNPQFK